MKPLLLAIALAACATGPSQPAASADVVIAAERAFAARAAESGWIPAFRAYASADAMLGQPGYPNAQAALAETPDDGNRNLQWWPAFAGVAVSGEFGFTTGPVSFDEARTPRGHYFTVWRRQSDGAWKWIYDGGVGPIEAPALIAQHAADVPSLPVARAGLGSPEAAIAAVRALEAEGALAYAPQAQRFRTRQPRALGAPAEPPLSAGYAITRIEASAAGDMVMVLGEGAEGLFARIWQLRPEGWRVVYDQLSQQRPPPAPG